MIDGDVWENPGIRYIREISRTVYSVHLGLLEAEIARVPSCQTSKLVRKSPREG